MKKNRLHFIICILATMMCHSCIDALVEDPDSYYQKDDFFTDAKKAEMAVVGIYNSLTALYADMEVAFPASDDTYYVTGYGNSDNARRDVTHYTLNTLNKYVDGVWKNTYTGLNRANYAIEGIEGMKDFSKNNTLRLLAADARFMRAFFSFNLVRYWGDVPYKTEYSKNYESSYQPRTPREVIYDQIIEDLNIAKGTLKWSSASNSPERASQGAARGLLMRVLLQRAGYSLQMDGEITRPADNNRRLYFEAVIKEWEAFADNHSLLTNQDAAGRQTGYVDLFKGFSAGINNAQESIFEIAFYTPDGTSGARGTWGTYNGPLVAAPGASAQGKHMQRANAFYRVVPEWKDFFEDSDSRRDVMVCTYQYRWDNTINNHIKVENRNNKDWYPGKWRREWMTEHKDMNYTDVNYCCIRYADVMLMAAEAYNETGETATAWELLNQVRIRAGATEITANNYTALLKAPKVYNLDTFSDEYTDNTEAGKLRTALYWERAFELAFEGQRKFDLIRWGVISQAFTLFGEKTSVNTPARTLYPPGITFKSGKHELFPIPADEIAVNYKLENKNNPNY